jgi:hypothetical protein
MSTESIFGSSKTEKVHQFLMLIKDPDVQPIFRMYIENILATSELKILKRLAAVETLLGLDDFSAGGDEEHELTIPEQLSLLAERIDDITELAKRESIPEPVPILTTKTEIRAHLLVEHLKNDGQDRSGDKFLSFEEIVHFLKYDIDEPYRVREDQNVRQTKKEVLDKAIKLFPNSVFLSKKAHGRRKVIIIYRP